MRDHRLIFHSLVAYLLSGIKMGSAGNVRSCNTYEAAILTCGRERGSTNVHKIEIFYFIRFNICFVCPKELNH